MSAAAALLARALGLGIHMWAEGGKLHYRGPKEALKPELVDELRQHKDELLGLLSDRGAHQASPPRKLYMERVAEWPPVLRSFWIDLSSRLASELGCSREEAELVASVRICMGYAGPLPPVVVEQGPDGAWPKWAEVYAGCVTWRFRRREVP